MKYFTAFVLLFSVLFLLSCSKKKEETSLILSRALEKAKTADWKEALLLSEKALSQEPSDVSALILNALALEKSTDSFQAAKAVDQAAKAASMAPKSFMAQYTYGRMLCRKGKYDAAIAPLENARKLKPEDINTIVLLAQSTAQSNNSAAFSYFAHLAKSSRFKNNPAVWTNLGILRLRQRQPKLAYGCFVKARQLAPNNPIATLNLAIVNDFYLNNKAEAATNYSDYQRLTVERADLEAKRVEVATRQQQLN